MEPEPLQPEAVEHQQRLTLRKIFTDLVTRFFSLERGWLCTAKELFTAPGRMIRRYIEGDRIAYANPFAYLLVATAISVVIQKSVGFQDWMMEANLSNPNLKPGQLEFIQGLQEFVFQHLLYVSLGILVPFAIILRLLFRRSGFNLAEMTVFALYTTGHTTLFAIVLLPLSRLFDTNPMWAIPVTMVYLCYAAIKFLGGRVLTVLKVCVAYGLAFAGYVFMVMVAAIIYVLTFGPSEFKNADQWELISAAEYGALGVAERLISEGGDVNMMLQRRPLHAAVERGDLEMVDLLLANGADVNVRNYFGQVPLFLALRDGHPQIARRLIEAGTTPVVTEAGWTLLMAGARSGNAELVGRLIELGSPVNAARPEGRRITALMMAADEGDVAVVQLLLQNGADPSIQNGDGKTALDYADNDTIAGLLRKAAAAQ